MKNQIIKSVRLFTKDRYLTVILSIFLVLCFASVVLLTLEIHPSELQVVVHYTAFGPTNFYRDKWFYLITFVVYILLIAVMHTIIAYKLSQKKGRDLTAAFIFLSIIILVVSTALFYHILKVASLS